MSGSEKDLKIAFYVFRNFPIFAFLKNGGRSSVG